MSHSLICVCILKNHCCFIIKLNVSECPHFVQQLKKKKNQSFGNFEINCFSVFARL